MRWSLLVALFAAPLLLGVQSAHVLAQPAGQTGQASARLGAIQSAIVKATGYRSHDVELTATEQQLVVKVVNSPLANAPNALRQDEASRIVAAIVRAMATKPEFQGIVAVHIDYVARQAGSGDSRTIDAIDFRKNPHGQFRHHMT